MVKKINFNTRVNEIEGKIPDVSSLVKKQDYTTEITNIKNAYVTNAALDARHKDLVQQKTFKSELKKVDNKTSENSSKVLSYEHKLKQTEDTINDFERAASYFRGKNYFDSDDGTQNYLVFQAMYKYLNTSVKYSSTYVSSWESKGLSNENISSIITPSYNRAPSLVYDNVRMKLKFVGSLLKQDKITYNHGPIVNIYIVFRLRPCIPSDITLENCLFGAVKMTKTLKINTYSGYGIAFDSKGSFSHLSGRYGKNVIIFRADLSSSVHANNRANNILVLGKEFIQAVTGTEIYAEKMYSTNFTVTNKKSCLSLHYNSNSSYLLVNGKEIVNFKAKDSEIVPYPLCLGNVSKDFSLMNTTNTGLFGYIYDFSVGYKAITNDKIHHIHRYLTEKNNIK